MDDINDIKARVEGAQAWKLFRASYNEQFPDDTFDIDNEPPETLTEKLKEKGYDNPSELLRFREDYKAEQNFFQGRSEEKKPDEDKEKNKTEKNGREHRQAHGHSQTYDAFEEEANEVGQEAADNWDKTKDPGVAKDRQDAFSKAKQDRYDKLAGQQLNTAKVWSEKLKKQKIRNTHLDLAIKKELDRRNKLSKNKGIRQKVLRTAGAGLLATTMLGAPSPAPQAPQQQNQTSSYTISIPRPSFTNIPRLPRTPRASYRPRSLATRGAKALGKNLAKTAAKTLEKTAARAAISAIVGAVASVPLLIVLFFVLIIIIVLIPFMFFFGGAPTTPPPLPGGVSYWLAAPPSVENGQNIDYQILFAYDPNASGRPDLNTLSLIDNIPTEATFVSATDPHACDPTCDQSAQSVTWRLSDLTPFSSGSLQFYRLNITLHPDSDAAVTNSLCLGIGDQPPICPVIYDAPPSGIPSETPTPTPVTAPECGTGNQTIDQALADLNVETVNINSCPRKQLLYTTVANVFSHSGFKAAMGTRRFVFEGSHNDKCGSGQDAANYRGCTEGAVRMRLRDFDTYGSDGFWAYIITHELFHVLDFRNSTFSTVYRNTLGRLETLPASDRSCYRINSTNFVIKTYDFDTKGPGESFAESGALYVLGHRNGRETISNFQEECPANYNFWLQAIK